MLRSLRQQTDRLALPLAVIGLAAVSWHNWRQWQRDKAMLAQRMPPEPLPPLESWPRLPKVSALVAAWNEAAHIEQHIQSFLALRYPHKELILCAGGTDDTYQIACRYAGEQVTVLEQQPGEGKQRALYRSLPVSKGEVIYLTDADCVVNDESFERIILPLATGQESVTSGMSQPLLKQQSDAFIQHQWAPLRYGEIINSALYANGILGRNAALKRPVVEAAWQAQETVPTGTDYYLALQVFRSGHRIRRVPDSIVESRFPATLHAYIRQRTRWLKNLLYLGYQYHDQHHIRHALQTSATGMLMLMMPVLALLVGRFGLVCWLLAWGAAMMVRVRYMSALNMTQHRGQTSSLSLDLLKAIYADWMAWSRVLVETVVFVGKRQW